ncbi:Uncharacterized protein HZ326_21702 [Fusarium oxysporum f. sp. albedinis]|nr:Uncharacterized protein HZ326_21702 [Fusarium oxysporum f. sp. albedinis]
MNHRLYLWENKKVVKMQCNILSEMSPFVVLKAQAKQLGAVEARRAHNPEVTGSKPVAAMKHFFFALSLSRVFDCWLMGKTRAGLFLAVKPLKYVDKEKECCLSMRQLPHLLSPAAENKTSKGSKKPPTTRLELVTFRFQCFVKV